MDTVIIAAAGASTRMQHDTSKVYLEMDGVPVLIRALAPARKIPSIGRVIVAVRLEDEARCRRLLRRWQWGAAIVMPGGNSRSETVFKALQLVPADDATVIVHDAARPCASESLWRTVMRAARVHGAAVPAMPVVDALKIVDNGFIEQAVPRNPGLHQIQTPQAFTAELLHKTYRAASADQLAAAPDDSWLVHSTGHPVATVHGESLNRKITFKNDLPPQM